MKKILPFLLLFCLILSGCTQASPEPTEDSIYPLLLSMDGYDGPECYLMQEPASTGLEDDYLVYARIDTTDPTWTEQAKKVITLVYKLYPSEERHMMCRVFKFSGDTPVKERTYENLLVTWEGKALALFSADEPKLTWFVNGVGNGLTQTKTESWKPE